MPVFVTQFDIASELLHRAHCSLVIAQAVGSVNVCLCCRTSNTITAGDTQHTCMQTYMRSYSSKRLSFKHACMSFINGRDLPS